MELAAPGKDIYSTSLPDNYGYMDGTSMACPHVTGVTALLLNTPEDTERDVNGDGIYETDGDGTWTNEEVRAILRYTADDLGNSKWYGYGLVNAAKAVDTIPPPAPVITSIDHPEGVWTNNNNPVFSWTEPQDMSGIKGYSYEWDGNPETEPPKNFKTSEVTINYSDVDDGEWYFHLQALDNAGNWGEVGHYGPIQIDTTPPNAPRGLSAVPGDAQVQLAWEANTEADIAGYTVYRSTNRTGEYSQINEELLTSPEFTDDGLTNGQTYWYKVSTLDMAGNESGESISVSATPQSFSPYCSISVAQLPQKIGLDIPVFAVTVTSHNNFSSPVNLSLTSTPMGAVGEFTPDTITPPANGSADSNLAVYSPNSPETYTLTISGSSETLTHEIQITAYVPMGSTPLITIEGVVYDINGDLAGNGFKVKVENITKDITESDVTGSVGDSQYQVTFLNFAGEAVATVSDNIRVTVTDENDNLVGKTDYTITFSDILGKATINVIVGGQFSLHLAKGINCISVPLKDERIKKLSDLANLVGPSLNLLIWYNAGQGKFISYLSTFPEDSPANAEVTGSLGLIAVMKNVATVAFVGDKWDGAVHLVKGINLIATPVEVTDFRFSDLASKIDPDKVSMVIRYDIEQGRFTSYKPTFPETSSANAFIRGGESYIVIMKDPASINFEGNAWSNTVPPSLPASPAIASQRISAPVLVTEGLVCTNNSELVPDGIKVTIRNLNTGESAIESTGIITGDGRYLITLIDIFGNCAAQIGDILEASALDSNGRFEVMPVRHTITRGEILAGKVTLESLRAIPFPKKSALLQNYPNPFNPETWIPYQLKEESYVEIFIYNLRGELVRTLQVGQHQRGRYIDKRKAAYWDGRTQTGECAASGVYFYVLKAGRFNQTKKMALMK